MVYGRSAVAPDVCLEEGDAVPLRSALRHADEVVKSMGNGVRPLAGQEVVDARGLHERDCDAAVLALAAVRALSLSQEKSSRGTNGARTAPEPTASLPPGGCAGTRRAQHTAWGRGSRMLI